MPKKTVQQAQPTRAAKTSKKPATKKASPKKATKKTTQSLSLLDAAAKVLEQADEPLNCKAIVEAAAEQKLWSSPSGKTPHNTLYSALLREINTKGADARFEKVERGLFRLKS